MANLFNPNTPVALGDEWFASVPTNHIVGPSFSCFAQQLRSTVAETIGTIRARVDGNASVTAPLYTVMDIIPAGAERPTLQTVTLLPNEDVTLGTLPDDIWVDATGSFANGWAKIDDAPVVLPIDSDGLHVRSTAANFPVVGRFRLNTAAIPAGARIVNVKILAVDSVTGPALAGTYVAYALRNGSNVYYPPNSLFGTQVYGNQRIIDCGEINPLTGLPWSPADIISFDTPGGWEVQIEGNTVSSGNARTTVWKLGLQVTYVTADNRVAFATWQRPPGAIAGDVDLAVRTAGTFAANWAKPSSGVFTYLWRSALAPLLYGASPIATDVRWLIMYQALGDAGNPPGSTVPPVPSMRGDRLSVDGFGIPIEDIGAGFEAAALALRTTAPATSDDSQPYFIRSGLFELLVADSGNVVAQRIRTGTNNNYLLVRFIVAPPPTGNSTLTVTVNRVSDGVQMGGAFTITAEAARALPEMPVGGKYVQGALSAVAALVAGTQYEIRFTPSTTDDWSFIAPRTVAGGGSASYGGTTDSARSGGSVLTEQDLVATLLVQPSAPANVRARILREQLDPDSLCGPKWREMAVIEWDAYSGLGASFDYFELQRLVDDGTDTWHTVKQISPESRVSAVDNEGPRNRPAKYRLRAVATTAAFSPWSETEFVTPTTAGPEIVLTSNARPDLTVVYDTEPGVKFQMLDHDGDTPVRIAGRPYQVVFTDPQPKGVGEAFRLIVNFGEQPVDALGRPIGRRAVFQRVQDLVRALDAAYVAVLDHYGNVTYGFVTLSSAVEEMPAWRYYVDAAVIPLTDTPAVVEDTG